MKRAKHVRTLACLVWIIALPCLVAGQGTTDQASTASTLPPAIPIMPMADVVLFPTLSVPLHIVESRDRAMVLDALKSDRTIGIVLRRPEFDPDFVAGPTPSIFPIGCAGVITDVEATADGGYDLVLQAVARFRITREDTGKPYRIAQVTAIPEARRADETSALQAERQKLETLLAGLNGRMGGGPVPQGRSDETFVNGVAQRVEIDPLDREKLLEQAGPLSRARMLIDLLKPTTP